MFGKKSSALPLAPGDRAPDFELPDHTGTLTRLSDLRGKRVVLWFYPKARTPG
jgi:peroxiredoxin Q/BCP